uniref:General vesicular transport factor p115 n=1 Tax=Gouania willdenowi TaxID=441366 RepID=A0A8C5EFC1_GOUWI
SPFLLLFLMAQPGGPLGKSPIQKLCDRVASSTLLEDRRDAVRALKSLSKKYRMEVGTQAMDHLINVLQTDRSDSEILGYALDTIYNLICNDEEEEQDENAQKQADDLGAQFTERFIQNPEHITLLLTLLEEFDFHVRLPGVKLLTALLKNQCVQVQGIILISPLGVSRMMDLLADSREVILILHMQASITLVVSVCQFSLILEKNLTSSIVVEDCLLLLLNLLKNNSSNQNFFKEGSYIQRMKPWFDVGDNNSGWSAQKVTNLHFMLQLVRVMVSPVNSPGATASCQKSMYHCGLLQQLCTILMATGVPADILTETINTVSEVIRGSQVNQDYFASVNAPSNPPRPAIVVLLMSMVNERQPFVLRCAVLYCFQCFLYKNQKGQGEIVATLLPSTIDANSISAGQLLCGGLFSADSLSNWCAAVALAHALQDNPTQKEQLLRVQLATSQGKPPVSLLQQCTNILSQGSKVQTRVGLLIAAMYMDQQLSIAVTHFLHNQENVPFLTAQISENLGEDERLVQGLCALLLGICIYYNDNSLENYTKEKLKQLIEKRIGKENFVEKLGFITKHELYSRAAQKPQPVFPSPEQMLFDHEFTKLVKELEGVITKAVHKSSEEEKKEEELIREQDTQIKELKEQVTSMTTQHEQMQNTLTQQLSQIQQHKDQYNILKLKLGRANLWVFCHRNWLGSFCKLREEMEEMRKQNTLLQSQLSDKDSIISSLQKLFLLCSMCTCTVNVLQDLEFLQSQVQSHLEEIDQLKSERQELIKREQTESMSQSRADMELQLASATSTVAILETEKSKLQTEVQESKKEQDDLLMLLADQDQKITRLRQRLKDLGETVRDLIFIFELNLQLGLSHISNLN